MGREERKVYVLDQKRLLVDKLFEAYLRGDKEAVLDLVEVLYQYLEFEDANVRHRRDGTH